MAADFRVRGCAMKLIDRAAERDTLDRFAAAIRAGQSQALVVWRSGCRQDRVA
jgi:hypothetical protein